MTATRPAVLFDIDGTLIDSNYFHSVAWWRALQDTGEDIPMCRIHRLIGIGSAVYQDVAELLESLDDSPVSRLLDGGSS